MLLLTSKLDISLLIWTDWMMHSSIYICDTVRLKIDRLFNWFTGEAMHRCIIIDIGIIIVVIGLCIYINSDAMINTWGNFCNKKKRQNIHTFKVDVEMPAFASHIYATLNKLSLFFIYLYE